MQMQQDKCRTGYGVVNPFHKGNWTDGNWQSMQNILQDVKTLFGQRERERERRERD